MKAMDHLPGASWQREQFLHCQPEEGQFMMLIRNRCLFVGVPQKVEPQEGWSHSVRDRFHSCLPRSQLLQSLAPGDGFCLAFLVGWAPGPCPALPSHVTSPELAHPGWLGRVTFGSSGPRRFTHTCEVSFESGGWLYGPWLSPLLCLGVSWLWPGLEGSWLGPPAPSVVSSSTGQPGQS